MKTTITIICAALGTLLQGQVIISENNTKVPTNSSVLLEFGTSPKGIILPSVESAPGAVGGTFIVNTTDKAVQYNNGSDWISLTDLGELVTHNFINAGNDVGNGVVIGASTTTKSGVLVLESDTKALVLPRVANPHLNIPSPIAGTMVYDTTSDAMAVYDGKNWSYWAAKDNETQEPPSNPLGTGSLTGRICFDVVEQYVGPECGDLAPRLPQKADFSQTTTNTQTYTFTPVGTVSNVRFVYINTNGQVIQSITPDANYSGNVSTAATATVVYYSNLNAAATGLSRENALTADIYVVYNNAASGAGTDVQLKLTANVQDCACCGAYIAAGVWKNFMCHNLGADETLDPNIPVVGLQGGYIQWGRKGPADWKTSGNTSVFAAAPTAANPNSGAISGWNTSGAGSTAWQNGTKTANDPCPAGWRVPTMAQWTGVVNYNTITRTGTWTVSTTNYGTAIHFGQGGTSKTLTLPAAGERIPGSTGIPVSLRGALTNRGGAGYYWSSTFQTANTSLAFTFFSNSDNGNGTFDTQWNYHDVGMSLRCIQE
jgi:uncharacterized protein (TIGR02145 family)